MPVGDGLGPLAAPVGSRGRVERRVRKDASSPTAAGFGRDGGQSAGNVVPVVEECA